MATVESAQVSPSTVNCGDTVTVSVKAWSGERQVTVEVALPDGSGCVWVEDGTEKKTLMRTISPPGSTTFTAKVQCNVSTTVMVTIRAKETSGGKDETKIPLSVQC